MASPTIRPALAAAVYLLFSVVSAQVCDLDPFDYYVRNPEELEELSKNCSTIQAWLYAHESFTGSFSLPGIKNITGGLIVGKPYAPLSGITDILLPDLEYVRDFRAYGVENISLPRLSTALHWLEILSPSNGRYNLPSLERVENIWVSGNLSTVSFDALQNATSITIQNRASEFRLQSLTTTVVDISFPVLKSAWDMHIEGNISSFSAPELTTIAPAGNYSSGKLEFEPYEPNLSIDLPKLAFVNGSVEIHGMINSLSLPMLRNVTGDLTIDSSSTEPLAIDLAVETTDQVELNGNIGNVTLPSLRNYSTMRISPDNAFDCEGLAAQLNGTLIRPVDRRENFFCSTGGAGGLSSKLGVVLGAAVAAAVLNLLM